MKEILLSYDAVSKVLDNTSMAFLQSTYEAAASLEKWDRMH
jgi:hypothetical protein